MKHKIQGGNGRLEMTQKYSEEFKESMLKRMMAPNPVPVMELCRETGVSDVTLYKWRKALLKQGTDMSKNKSSKQKWSASEQLNIIIETSSMNEHDLGEYCRSKGLYPEQIEEWKSTVVFNSGQSPREKRALYKERQNDRKQIKKLERELKRKEKALAEAAALLVLSKKWNAFLEAKEED